MGALIAEIGVLPTSAGGVLVIIFLLFATGRIPTLRELRDSQEREARALEREAKAMELANKWQSVAEQHGMTLTRILDTTEDIHHIVGAIQTGLSQGGEAP